MLARLPIILLLIQPLLAQQLTNDQLRSPVALVSCGDQIGSAISVGMTDRKLYLVTAYHVIAENPQDFSIRFWQVSEPVRGKVVNSDPDLDLAVISCTLPGRYMPSFFPFSTKNLQENMPVILVGHPHDNQWDINRISRIKTTTHGIQPGKLTVYPNGVGPGSSGGAVLSEEGALLGIVTETDPVKAICLNTNLFREACKQWGVPVTFFSEQASRMVPISGGTFTMGSNEGNEQPIHNVTVPSFYLGAHEVTVAQFQAFIDATGYQTDAEKNNGSYFFIKRKWEIIKGITWQYDPKGNYRESIDYQQPVVHISWNDAQAYCKWLSEQTGQRYRLPTEAEWEYAAGGGSGPRTTYAGTNSDSNLGDYAWYTENSNSSTSPVGQKKPNSLGLYDMAGNVWEWCQDDYEESYQYSPVDGSAREIQGSVSKVQRGGSWFDESFGCGVTYRMKDNQGVAAFSVGFRVAMTP